MLNRDEARARRGTQTPDSRLETHKPPPKFEIFIRRRHAFTFARRRGGERKARQRNAKKARQKEIKYATNRPSRRGHCHGQKKGGRRKQKKREKTAKFDEFFSRGRNRSERDAEKGNKEKKDEKELSIRVKDYKRPGVMRTVTFSRTTRRAILRRKQAGKKN